MADQEDIEGQYQIENLNFPKINYIQRATLAAPPLNNFAICLSLFMIAAAMMGWIKYESPTLGSCIGIGGIALYFCGFYDWYQRNTMASFMDFIFALLNFTIYETASLGKYDDDQVMSLEVPHNYYSYLQGTFYVIYLIGVLFLILGIGTKGPLNLVSFVMFALGLVFVIVWENSHYTWSRKAAGYFIFFGTIFFWICGLGKLLQKVFGLPEFPVVSPAL